MTMYTMTITAFAISLLVSFAYPQTINKPALQENLDYLKDGLKRVLPPVEHTFHKWDEGWIPQFCLDESKSEDHPFDPANDIKTYDVKYDDCDSPWIVCVHKDGMSKEILADLFGRVPVGSRSFIRHVLTIPNEVGGAINANDNMLLFALNEDGLEAILHEVGHSLDSGAYPEKLSESKEWKEKTSLDRAIPDKYAGTDAGEDVAQSHVIATYNILVDGGFPRREPRWEEVRNQYETVQMWQRERAKNKNLLVPGGSCANRRENTKAVPVPNGKKLLRGRSAPWRRSQKPDTSLAEGLEIIEPAEFNTGMCGRDIESKAWGPARQHF